MKRMISIIVTISLIVGIMTYLNINTISIGWKVYGKSNSLKFESGDGATSEGMIYEKDNDEYWKSFLVCTREDGGVWEDRLKGKLYRKGIEYATEGYVIKGSTNDSFTYNVVNSGWDAEYNSDGSLSGDNPWGMTVCKNNIKVESGRDYTISFKIKSTLCRKSNTEDITSKHIRVRIYCQNDESNELAIESINGISNGFIALDSNKNQYEKIGADEDGYVSVFIKVHIPVKNNSNIVAFKFGFGANLLSYSNELSQQGLIIVKDFTVIPGEKETIESATTQATTVIPTIVSQTEETTRATTDTTTHDFITKKETTLQTKVERKEDDITEKQTNSKDRAIGKTKITKVKVMGKKSIRLTWKKIKEAKMYQIQYATSKKFKKSKVKMTSRYSILLKNLKRKKTYYIRIRGINNAHRGKWSTVKRIKR